MTSLGLAVAALADHMGLTTPESIESRRRRKATPKPLTPEQRERKNARARERRAEQRDADREDTAA